MTNSEKFKNHFGLYATELWCMSEEEFVEWLNSEVNDWILVSDRLPEEDGDYLVLYYTRSKFKPYVYDVMSFANDLYQIDDYDFIDRRGQKGWFHYDREYGFCEDNSVYAWMPLPEPYKKLKENTNETD